VGLIALSLTGLGCPKRLGGDVHGKVTLDGKPLPSGTVALVYADGVKIGATIQEDGTYYIPKPPRGDAKVTVEILENLAPLPSPAKADPKLGGKEFADELNKMAPAKPPQIVPVPAKYKDPTSSGMAVSVGGRSQEFNIELVGEKK
jgi:hypothetical protein